MKQAVSETKKIKRSSTCRGKILLMEDDEAVMNTLGRMLVSLGYEVDFSSEGAQAIKLYTQARESGEFFDVVILDLMVNNGLDGKETIGKLLKIDPDIKVIISSACYRDPVMNDPCMYGFNAALKKPYTIEVLNETLSKVNI